MHAGVESNVAMLGALANDLTMYLALRRHIDDDVAPEQRLAAQAPTRLQRVAFGSLVELPFHVPER